MPSTIAEIERRLHALESELSRNVDDAPSRFLYQLQRGKIHFAPEAVAEHKKLRTRLWEYARTARVPVVITAPVIYVGIVPFVLLDLFLTVYQGICFPIYGIPKVRRADYFFFDRGRLQYLNALERFNCRYCSYANALCEYVTEIAGRTEQHWCPIKHAFRIPAPHSRYEQFADYGDAAGYRRELESMRKAFADLQNGQA
jgi:hypothetical protein